MALNARMRYVADDALLSLLAPIWQLLIGVCLLVVCVIAAHRLFMRGPSRMSRAVVLAGGAVVGMLVLGMLLSMA
jgi:hypothetical protein